jgi:hypothetical protein
LTVLAANKSRPECSGTQNLIRRTAVLAPAVPKPIAAHPYRTVSETLIKGEFVFFDIFFKKNFT